MKDIKNYIFKVLLIGCVAYAIIMMVHWPIGFTFFTQLSNIFAAVVMTIQLIYESKRNADDTEDYARPILILKFMASVSLFVTFLVFLLFLAPFVPGGYAAAYTQDHCASLCMHLIAPVLIYCDLFICDRKRDWRSVPFGFSALPFLVYFVFIMALGAFGFRWRFANGTVMSAPYAFLNYASPAGWFGFMPETLGATGTGIGVFYVVIVMTAAILLIGKDLHVRLCRSGSDRGDEDYTDLP
ncbi:MAG: hypothetical protein J6D53_07400 [Blautia sp.]|nr:hypothetical protein [Blautia sp.]